jgi:hypothetical protein
MWIQVSGREGENVRLNAISMMFYSRINVKYRCKTFKV